MLVSAFITYIMAKIMMLLELFFWSITSDCMSNLLFGIVKIGFELRQFQFFIIWIACNKRFWQKAIISASYFVQYLHEHTQTINKQDTPPLLSILLIQIQNKQFELRMLQFNECEISMRCIYFDKY